jgi:hypothetical protein
MHSRSRNRASITADSLRREHAAAPRLVSSNPTPIAFGVVAGALTVTRSFEISFPFSGGSIAFAASEAIHLSAPEDWVGGESIVIVVERGTIVADPERPYRLTAMPKSEASRADTVVGGFDLDPECAVLAGSFWDANLESTAPAEEPEAVARIADIFVRRQRDGFDDTTQDDLVREGISEADILAHYDAAAARGARALREYDRDVADTPASYDRQARVKLGAVALAGELDPNRVHTTLRLAGLTTREIGNLFDDIIGESLRLVRESGAAAIREVA